MELRKKVEAISYTTDVEFAYQLLDELSTSSQEDFVNAIRQMAKSHYLRDPIFDYLIDGDVELSANDWSSVLG